MSGPRPDFSDVEAGSDSQPVDFREEVSPEEAMKRLKAAGFSTDEQVSWFEQQGAPIPDALAKIRAQRGGAGRKGELLTRGVFKGLADLPGNAMSALWSVPGAAMNMIPGWEGSGAQQAVQQLVQPQGEGLVQQGMPGVDAPENASERIWQAGGEVAGQTMGMVPFGAAGGSSALGRMLQVPRATTSEALGSLAGGAGAGMAGQMGHEFLPQGVDPEAGFFTQLGQGVSSTLGPPIMAILGALAGQGLGRAFDAGLAPGLLPSDAPQVARAAEQANVPVTASLLGPESGLGQVQKISANLSGGRGVARETAMATRRAVQQNIRQWADAVDANVRSRGAADVGNDIQALVSKAETAKIQQLVKAPQGLIAGTLGNMEVVAPNLRREVERATAGAVRQSEGSRMVQAAMDKVGLNSPTGTGSLNNLLRVEEELATKVQTWGDGSSLLSPAALKDLKNGYDAVAKDIRAALGNEPGAQRAFSNMVRARKALWERENSVIGDIVRASGGEQVVNRILASPSAKDVGMVMRRLPKGAQRRLGAWAIQNMGMVEKEGIRVFDEGKFLTEVARLQDNPGLFTQLTRGFSPQQIQDLNSNIALLKRIQASGQGQLPYGGMQGNWLLRQGGRVALAAPGAAGAALGLATGGLGGAGAATSLLGGWALGAGANHVVARALNQGMAKSPLLINWFARQSLMPGSFEMSRMPFTLSELRTIAKKVNDQAALEFIGVAEDELGTPPDPPPIQQNATTTTTPLE